MGNVAGNPLRSGRPSPPNDQREMLVSIFVTGATGQVGGLVVEALLARGVEAEDIVAAGRNAGRLDELAARGVRVAAIDLDDSESLHAAFKGSEKLLLISGSDVGHRLRQHKNAIGAATQAGIKQIIYTSILRAGRSSLQLAVDHGHTEEALRGSGVPFVLLRNGWYLENYTAQVRAYLQYGGIAGSAGDGRISGAARADYAEAAAAVLTGDGHDGAVYELGGDEAFTMSELAAEISHQTGQRISYQDMPVEAYVEYLVSAGLPRAAAEILADADRGVAAGELHVDSGDLHRLIGRRTTRLSEAVRIALG